MDGPLTARSAEDIKAEIHTLYQERSLVTEAIKKIVSQEKMTRGNLRKEKVKGGLVKGAELDELELGDILGKRATKELEQGEITTYKQKDHSPTSKEFSPPPTKRLCSVVSMPPTVIVREGEKDILEEVEHKKLSSQVRRAIPSENSCLGDVRIIVEGGKDIYINEKKMEEKAKERDKREKNETNIQEGERITVVKRTKSDIQILPIISNKEERKRPVLPHAVVRRSKLMFSNLQSHLTKAKNRLEQEKGHFQRQSQIENKICNEIKKANIGYIEKEMDAITIKKVEKVNQKRKLNRKILELREELFNKKIVTYYETLGNNFILTKSTPKVFWTPVERNKKIEEYQKETEEIYKVKIDVHNLKYKKFLEDALKDYDEKYAQKIQNDV